MKSLLRWAKRSSLVALGLLCGTTCCSVNAQEPDFPPMEKVVEGYTKVQARTADGNGLCGIWTRDKDGQMFLELPKDFANKKYFIALTVSSGDQFAGLQSGDFYVYFRLYNKRLAMIVPNMDIRSTGEDDPRLL